MRTELRSSDNKTDAPSSQTTKSPSVLTNGASGEPPINNNHFSAIDSSDTARSKTLTSYRASDGLLSENAMVTPASCQDRSRSKASLFSPLESMFIFQAEIEGLPWAYSICMQLAEMQRANADVTEANDLAGLPDKLRTMATELEGLISPAGMESKRDEGGSPRASEDHATSS